MLTNPDLASAHYHLALALANSGDSTGALPEISEAISLQPGMSRRECSKALYSPGWKGSTMP